MDCHNSRPKRLEASDLQASAIASAVASLSKSKRKINRIEMSNGDMVGHTHHCTDVFFRRHSNANDTTCNVDGRGTLIEVYLG